MPELREILPRPACVAKQGSCAESPSVKTMLADAGHSVLVKSTEFGDPPIVGELFTV